MTERHYIVATAGHVDHGKSALVKALTGTDPDRLPEEKTRKITIDLGFAELKLKASTPDAAEIHVGIVDVPGHEDFLRNMIAGVGSIDLALFVVAADDGWMPQTEEHLQILTYLGVNRAVFALTKIDIGNAEAVGTQIREQTRGTPFADSLIVPVSARDSLGLDELRRALAQELSAPKPAPDIGKPRLFVDRVFSLQGIGTIATGTLTGGSLRRGDATLIQPRNLSARIRSIQNHGREVDDAKPATRTAINLTDMTGGVEIKRGDIATTLAGEASRTLDVILQRSSRLKRTNVLKTGSSVYLHHGTARVRAKVALLDGNALRPGESGIAQLRLVSPIFAFLGDRFVLRDGSEQHTIGGGVVLDPDGNAKHFRRDAQRRLLEARAAGHMDVDVCVSTELERRGASVSNMLLGKSRFSATEVQDALQRLAQRGDIFLDGEIAAHAGTWETLRAGAAAFIDADHKAYPERSGTKLNDLRARFSDQSAETFDALVLDLAAHDFIRSGTTIARRSHRPVLPEKLQVQANKILEALSANPFDPPTQKTNDDEMHKALRFLIEQGQLVDLGTQLVLTADVFAQMKGRIAEFLAKRGAATVSELRQELGTSRRVIVPLLERLDRDRVTQRVGDQRKLIEKL